MARSFSGGLGRVNRGLPPTLLITVAIAAMNRRTETRADSLHPSLFCSDVKGAARSNRYPPHVDPLFRAARNHCSDQISGLEALDLFGPFGLGAGKTKLIDIAFLAA